MGIETLRMENVVYPGGFLVNVGGEYWCPTKLHELVASCKSPEERRELRSYLRWFEHTLHEYLCEKRKESSSSELSDWVCSHDGTSFREMLDSFYCCMNYLDTVDKERQHLSLLQAAPIQSRLYLTGTVDRNRTDIHPELRKWPRFTFTRKPQSSSCEYVLTLNSLTVKSVLRNCAGAVYSIENIPFSARDQDSLFSIASAEYFRIQQHVAQQGLESYPRIV